MDKNRNKGYVVFCSKAKHLSGYFEDYQEIELSKKTFSGKEILIFSDKSFIIEDSGKNNSVLVVQNLVSANDDLMELLLTLDLFKRANTKNINVLIPYFAYSRQDKIYSSISSVGFNVAYKLISSFDVENIYSIDVHSSLDGVNIINIDTTKIFGEHILEKLLKEQSINIDDISIISPDFGSRKRAKGIANFIKTEKVYFFEKSRISEVLVKISDNPTKINDLFQEDFSEQSLSKQSKICIIVDDIISSGSTINECAKKLRSLGAEKIFCYCSHFLDFSVISSNLTNIDKILVSNTCYTNCYNGFNEIVENQKFTNTEINVEIIEIKELCSNIYKFNNQQNATKQKTAIENPHINTYNLYVQ